MFYNRRAQTRSGDIPGWIIFIIGLVVSIFSAIVNSKSEESPMAIFLVMGIALIFYGLVKSLPLIAKLRGQNKPKKEENKPVKKSFNEFLKEQNVDSRQKVGNLQQGQGSEEYHKEHSHNHPSNKSNQSMNNSNSGHNKHVIHCPKCKYALHKTDNFCYNCGMNVQHL